MGIEENKQLYRDFIKTCVNNGEAHRVPEFVAADYHDHHRYVEGVAPGAEGEQQVLEMLAQAFSEVNNEIELLVAEGDLVVAYGVFNAVHTGDYVGLPATGKKLSVPSFDIVRIKDGKLQEHWGMIDSATMMAQLGISGG